MRDRRCFDIDDSGVLLERQHLIPHKRNGASGKLHAEFNANSYFYLYINSL